MGYDVDPSGGRLVVNEEEAERVRAVFALFEEYGSARLTLAAAFPVNLTPAQFPDGA